jgi:N-acetylneuraminic acid mutarotase
MPRITPLEEITVSDKWNWGSVRLISLLSATMALGMVACTSEETPTQPETAGDQSMATLSPALASNSWTTKAPLPDGPFGVSAGMAVNSAGQSIVYTFGGQLPDSPGPGPAVVEAYNVATNTWTSRSAHVQPVTRGNGVGKIGSKLYFSGGYYGDELYASELDAYDYGTDRMIKKADMPKHTGDGVTGVINGKLYVLPGTCELDDCATNPIRRLYRYDPATNTWVAGALSPHVHKNGAAGVINGKFYVAGGLGVTDLDVYNPATNTWKTLAPLPTAGRAIGAALGGKLFVISSGNTFGDEVHSYAYNPATNTWKIRTSPTWGHGAAVRVVLNGTSRLLAVGESHGPNCDIPNDSELYTP